MPQPTVAMGESYQVIVTNGKKYKLSRQSWTVLDVVDGKIKLATPGGMVITASVEEIEHGTRY